MMSNTPVIFCKNPEYIVLCDGVTHVSKMIVTVNMTRVPAIVGREEVTVK